MRSSKGSFESILLMPLVLLVVILILYAVNFYRVEKDISFRKPFWFFLFNDVFPKATFDGVIKNNYVKENKNFAEGVLILEIAEDEGLGVEPSREKYHFFAYSDFDTIKPGAHLTLKFVFPEEYKPARFRIRPTLFIYPQGKSPIKVLRKTMANQGADVLKAWEYVFFAKWMENLSEVPGVLISINNKSYLITTYSFYTVLGISGIVSLLIAIMGLLGKLAIKKASKDGSIPGWEITLAYGKGGFPRVKECFFLEFNFFNNTGKVVQISNLRITDATNLFKIHPFADKNIVENSYSLKFINEKGIYDKRQATMETGSRAKTGIPLSEEYSDREMVALIKKLNSHVRSLRKTKYFILKYVIVLGQSNPQNIELKY